MFNKTNSKLPSNKIRKIKIGSNNKKWIANSLRKYAFSIYYLNDIEKALHYLDSLLELRKEIGDDKEIYNCYILIGKLIGFSPRKYDTYPLNFFSNITVPKINDLLKLEFLDNRKVLIISPNLSGKILFPK